MDSTLTLSVTCKNANNILLLLILHALLEEEDELDLSCIATPQNRAWLLREVKDRIGSDT